MHNQDYLLLRLKLSAECVEPTITLSLAEVLTLRNALEELDACQVLLGERRGAVFDSLARELDAAGVDRVRFEANALSAERRRFTEAIRGPLMPVEAYAERLKDALARVKPPPPSLPPSP